MNKKLLFYASLAIIIFSCGKDDFQQAIDATEADSTIDKISSKDDINNLVFNALAEERIFKWSELDVDDLWTVIELSDNQINVFWRMDDSSSKTENDIENIILKHENIIPAEEESPIFHKDKELHYLSATVQNKETIEALFNSGRIETIEPLYTMVTDEELNAQPANKPNKPRQSSKNNDRWRYPYTSFNKPYSSSAIETGVDIAWERGFDGKGIELAVVDMGIKEGHPVFSDLERTYRHNFKNPITNRNYKRLFKRRSTYPACFFPWDWQTCEDDGFAYGGILHDDDEHGIEMLTVIGGIPQHTGGRKPRKDEYFWGTGVAYASNLISVRASDQVFIIGPKRHIGVERAFKYLSNQKNVKIISMSMGTLWYDTAVARAIRLAHRKGKMIFTAAGTLPDFLNMFEFFNSIPSEIGKAITLFPASMKEVYGVTGVDETGSWSYRSNGRADFVVKFNDRFISDHGEDRQSGSSSVATGTIAGIAALIWATDNKMSREQVYDIMRKLSQRPDRKHRYFGHGTLDLSGFYGAKEPIEKAKKVRFKGVESSNLFFTVGKLDRHENADLVYNHPRQGQDIRFQKLKVIHLKGKTIALKATNGKYIGLDRNGNLKASGPMIGAKQKFEIYTNNDGEIALKGSNKKFVTVKGASNGSRVRCTSSTADEYAWFKMN